MKKNDNTLIFLTIIFIIAILFIGGVLAFFTKKFGDTVPTEINKFANFGDFIGGTLNPILAFLALIALLYTIKLQSDELKATRKELKKTVTAQKKQAKSLKLQNKATKLQIFENTFFQLISIFIELKSNFTVSRRERVDGFENGSPTTNFIIREMTYHETIHSFLDELKLQYLGDYEKFNNSHECLTGSYFSQIYQIIKFIDDSDIDSKQRYINIFRAQFTENELELLFYHCLGNIGKRKFKGLIEKYEFFEHITYNVDIEKSLKEYDINAFGSNQTLIDKYNGV